MNIDDFKRALVAFADDASDLDLTKGHLLVQIGDELIEASIETSEGDLYVTEHGNRHRAFLWLVKRIARIPLLADRILTHIAAEPHFVTPSGRLVNYLEDSTNEDELIHDVPAKLPQLLSAKPATSSVLYITSQAGEGKTTLINRFARLQAERYKNKRANWLLLPISLGGRAFMTFDDIVVAELVNKLRFHLFHYDAFLEMVRLGVLVPAFDGFEEMFVAGASGEALSALGNLITDLESSGSVLVAARVAYFHYRNFKTQAKLFDSIQDGSVDFAQLDLERWTQSQFLKYANLRKIPDGRRVYDQVLACLGQERHPLLTRAVLVARLLDLAADNGIQTLISRLSADPDDYFHQFVSNIVEREANTKWIDQQTPHQPLLTTGEHHALLGDVAKEMWMTSSDALRGDYLDLVADLVVDELGKPPQIKRQIVQRVRQHALIARSPGSDVYTFDHDDFRQFYLGVAVARIIHSSDTGDLIVFLGKGELPVEAVDSALNAIRRGGGDLIETLKVLQALSRVTSSTSHAMDNVGALTIRLLERVADDETVEAGNLTFPLDALNRRQLGKVTFRGCQFQSTSVQNSSLGGCRFVGCTFHQLELPHGFDARGAVLDRCEVICIMTPTGYVYDPVMVQQGLKDVGFNVKAAPKKVLVEVPSTEPDEESKVAERALRIFMRATQINEEVFRRKLGDRANMFFQSVLPKMLDNRVLEEVPYRGGGTQHRYKLCVPMSKIGDAVPIPQGVESLDQFLEVVVQDI